MAYPSFPLEGTVSDDPRFFFHTAMGCNQSITIDFDCSRGFRYLVIYNRVDECHERARSLFCIIHESMEFSVDNVLPVAVLNDFMGPNGSPSVTPLFGQRGRYITIYSPIHTALHFSSIRVF